MEVGRVGGCEVQGKVGRLLRLPLVGGRRYGSLAPKTFSNEGNTEGLSCLPLVGSPMQS